MAVKVLVTGDFYVVHPGHTRLLKFAKNYGNELYIGVNNLCPSPGLLTPAERVSVLETLGLNAVVFIIENDLKSDVDRIRPNYIVKGNEYKYKQNPETEWISSWGGQLIFASGDTNEHLAYIGDDHHALEALEFPLDYIERHSCDTLSLRKILKNFANKKVLVIGDLIVDEYIQCTALGMSREDPTLVVSPIDSEKYLGGASIVASHAANLADKVTYIGVAGCDNDAVFAEDKLAEYGVKSFLISDQSRCTTLKQRFRVGEKTMLRVSHLKQHEISQSIELEVYAAFEQCVNQVDIVIISDFNYGCMSRNLIAKILNTLDHSNLMIGVDCQTSSQVGDITKYSNVTVMTPTEHEARTALRDPHAGLQNISHNLIEKTNVGLVLLTLGSDGVLITSRSADPKTGLHTDTLPAFNKRPVDPSGAGDSMLIVSSLALSAGASVFQAAYLGSLASSIQVSRVGNIPIKLQEFSSLI